VSRSNPSEHLSNPSTRWFEWNGEAGLIRYYDKDKKENVDVPLPFTFLLLDQLGSVRGWHDASGSGIYSNEVKDTTKEPLVVKAFKGGTIAEGLYREIKDRCNTAGGSFNANCYLAFKDGDSLEIGCLRFKGAALGAWMDFSREHRGDLYKIAIKIDDFTEGKKGRIVFRVPAFKALPVSDQTNADAEMLDEELQTFLSSYLTRNTRDQAVESAPRHVSDEDMAEEGTSYDHVPPAVTDDDIPF
jgi:hypothetical protein